MACCVARLCDEHRSGRIDGDSSVAVRLHF